MKRSTAILFFVTLLFCAPAWFSISFQIKYIPSEFAVGLRFLIAGAALEVYRWFRNEKQEALSPKTCLLIIFQGFFLYSVNYWLCYEAANFMVTGLIAATVSTMIIPNLLFGKIFLNKPIRPSSCIGALFGLIGVFFLFQTDIMNIDRGYGALPGFALAFSSTFFSVIGTTLVGKVLAKGVSVLFTTSRALISGGVFSLTWSYGKYGLLYLPSAPDFVISFLYLTFLATTFGAILYSRLIEEVGPGLASYLWIIMPTLCLAISALFEGFEWTMYSTLGLISVTLGGAFATSGERLIQLFRKRIPDLKM